VTLTLVIENTGTAPALVIAPSAQLYDFAVFHGDREVWRWSADRGFAAQITEWTLAPGERREFSEAWRPAPGTAVPGEYIAEATLAGGRLLGVQPLRLAIHVR
jgi:Intracellular proteinase inhibitor